MKIRHKLIIGYLAAALLVAAMGYLGITMTRTAKEGFSMAANQTIPVIRALEVLRLGGLRIVSSTNEFGFIRAEKQVIGQNMAQSEKEEERLIELGTKLYNDASKEYEDVLNRSSSKDDEFLQDIGRKGLRLQETSEELIDLKRQGVSGLEVLKKKEVFEKNEKAFLAAVDAAISYEGKDFLRRKARLESAMEVNRNVGIAATLISVIAAIVIGTLVSRSISNPLTRLRDAAGEIGKGKLDARAEIKSNDEIGQLAASFNKMGEDLRRYHKHLEDLVEIRTAELRIVNQQLQQEVTERKQAEEALRKVGDELEQRIEERTAKLAKTAEQLELELTERNRAEEALRESQEKYSTLVENSLTGIYIDQDGKIVFANQRFADIYGYSRDELAGMESWRLVHLEDRPLTEEIRTKRLRREEAPKEYEARGLRKDGETIWVLRRNTYVEYKGRAAVLGNIVDITNRKRLEAQLLQAQKLEAIGTLAGGIAHDFNNLLMGIQGHISLMHLGIDSSHPHYERLKNIEKQVESGARLTSLLLGYASKGKYEVKPLDLNRLVEETSETFGRTRKEITIHRELAEDLFAIEADEVQMEQVLLNLFVNAADAMPGGGDLVLKTIKTSHHDIKGKLHNPKPGKYVVLVVTDTGTGMDKDTLERIFDPFFTTKEMGRGTGLGLASAYGIIRGHGGYIEVDSKKGHGTTFSICLPASEKTVSNAVKITKPFIERTGTVLVVDDEELILEVTKELLEEMGYRVVVARDGKQAVDVYRKNRDDIDIILLDMVMPNMGGGEVYDRLKEINPDIKVLLSSGYSIDGKASEILQRGCNGFIQKPFNVLELSHKIGELIDRNGL